MRTALFTLPAILFSPSILAQTNNEQVLGVYIFHRHGDRTAKSTPPVNLTTLGYDGVLSSGQYYRSRYITSGSGFAINGISIDIVVQSQISVSAPQDVVLQNSATGFLQGLYPPVGELLAASSLRNGSKVDAPLNGYQLVPVNSVAGGSGSEGNAWLQSASGCNQATTSSNRFFSSAEYSDLLGTTQGFYDGLYPLVNSTFNQSQVNFKNAYSIYDLINVAGIHNSSFDEAGRVTQDVFSRLQTLADAHEWGLAYNESESVAGNVRGVSAMVLAGQILDFLNGTLSTNGNQKIAIQFGAYATFSSFFGFAELPQVDPNFRGIATYASSMVFELFTNSSTAASDDPASDVYVRFLFSNGTASTDAAPSAYPLFGSQQEALSWRDFTAGMQKFAVSSTNQWCNVCGNSDGVCAASKTSSSNGSSIPASSLLANDYAGDGSSPAVNGVIGAMVTLAVVLGLEMIVVFLGGWRIVSKRRLRVVDSITAETAIEHSTKLN
ncbi:phosphoglycerate mutase-like protein [Aureobasidium pullulans]|uniref:Phosphoglycerate mutase-like protein n=1 Tax=Aureobasidium pullulans TaxID=5580 RepID=A0A4T0BEH1_AURPU|nr:phosphoglycerate mutase-like protein [Aureobasidium pullulans]